LERAAEREGEAAPVIETLDFLVLRQTSGVSSDTSTSNRTSKGTTNMLRKSTDGSTTET
jgi:hypothetical protein